MDGKIAHQTECFINSIAIVFDVSTYFRGLANLRYGMKIHLDRSQDLSDLIVQLAGNSSPLILLGFDELARKHLEGILSEFAFRDIAGDTLNSDHNAVLINRAATNFDGYPATVLCYDVDFKGSF